VGAAGLGKQLDAGVRGDRMAWLGDTRGGGGPAGAAVGAFPLAVVRLQFEALRCELARTVWPSLAGGFCKLMLACYPGGADPPARYARHTDASPLCPDRVATAILYLNPDHMDGDGGELAVYPPALPAAGLRIAPAAGRLALFGALVEHEVLPVLRGPRWAVTAFMYRPPPPAPPPAPAPMPAASRPVLFVDVDGVMHPAAGGARFAPACMAELARVQRATDCELVLSSSWRLKPESAAAVGAALAKAGLPALAGATAPFLRQSAADAPVGPRALEVHPCPPLALNTCGV
jgi:SM-20-related protein